MIEVHQVTYVYPGQDEPAVREASLSVAPGETVGIVGPNGSGKSTAARLMKALLLPFEGTVRVDELDTRADQLEVRRRVGLVFQNPNSQIVNSVVEQEVAFGPENIGLPTDEIRRRVSESLRAVGLEGRERDECHSMSMADKQRVALAGVLALHPSYLILDEATAWIEPSARWLLLDEILSWSSAHGAGLVMVTHRMDEAQLCGRLYGTLDGRVAATGNPDQILHDPDIRRRLSLDVPETYALAEELRRAGVPVAPDGSVERLAGQICRS